MAKGPYVDNGRLYVVVVKNDTLSGIAATFTGKTHTVSGKSYTVPKASYQQLATINSIKNANLIYIDQKVYLTSASSGGSSSSSSTPPANKPVIKVLALQAGEENTLYATWEWSKWKDTESYELAWEYTTVDGMLFKEGSKVQTVDQNYHTASEQATYSIPANATKVLLYVRAVPIVDEKNGKKTSRFTGTWSDVKTFVVSGAPPAEPDGLKVEMVDGYKLKVEVDTIDLSSTNPPVGIEFKVIYSDNTVFDTEKVTITKKADTPFGHVSYMWPVTLGRSYQVACRAYNKSDMYSDWVWDDTVYKTVPPQPDDIVSIQAINKSEILIEWNEVETAESYEIQYTTETRYFDISENVQSKTFGKEVMKGLIDGLEMGDEYFFRLRAINEAGDSGWTPIVSIIIGEKPAAPTTWSSTTTAIVGEPLNLYWIHNSKDNSFEKGAKLKMDVRGVSNTTIAALEYEFTDKPFEDEDNIITHTPLTEDERKEGKTSHCQVDTSNLLDKFENCVRIVWYISTEGITGDDSDFSIPRTVDIYEQPTLELNIYKKINDSEVSITDVLNSFPFYIRALAGPKSQRPISYYLTVVANESYTTIDSLGNDKTISAGQAIYSKYFDTSDQLMVEFSANNIDLENNISYTAICTVSMNSGLTTEASKNFTVTWEDKWFEPSAEITYDSEKFITHIKPYCRQYVSKYYKVNYASGKYVTTTEDVGYVYGEPVTVNKKPKFTTTGEQVYSGTTADGDDIYFCIKDESYNVDNITLSVYRREFDGSFIEIMTGLDSSKNTAVTDPHPSLDYARYRIVATSNDTGSVSYYDVPGYPINEPAIIIQWDEVWASFDSTEESDLAQPPWTGSLLRLPYNVDVSDKNSPDVTKVAYAGRKRPVTYYGTQLGETSSWSTVIPKDDKDTLYAIRRLAIWMGDVYVREPSGTGYWANINVSYDLKHKDTTIPITFEITRVEGGM